MRTRNRFRLGLAIGGWLGLVLPASLTVAQESQEHRLEAWVDRWQSEEALRREGVDRADRLRRRWVDEDGHLTADGELLGSALERFAELEGPGGDRPSLGRFEVEPRMLADQLAGRVAVPATVFDAFAGRWYGRWDQMEVDHWWLPAESRELEADSDSPRVTGEQFAWIGDGFGWNYLIAPTPGTGRVVLGMVYHFEDPRDPDVIRLERPHVGLFDGPGRLVWITGGEIFFEEFLQGALPDDDRYAITGFFFELDDVGIRNRGDAFQAIYTRDPDHRPEFVRWPIRVEASRKP